MSIHVIPCHIIAHHVISLVFECHIMSDGIASLLPLFDHANERIRAPVLWIYATVAQSSPNYVYACVYVCMHVLWMCVCHCFMYVCMDACVYVFVLAKYFPLSHHMSVGAVGSVQVHLASNDCSTQQTH
jgi:hypothetical protein